jgi:sigma-E factor negative regulatory protein RseB
MKLQSSVLKMAGVSILMSVLMSVTQVYALTPAQELVEKMSLASKNLTYKGYFSYERGQQSSSYKIVHWVQGDTEKERLVFLDGKPLEIINDGHSLQCIHAGDIEHDIHLQQSVNANPVHVLHDSLDAVWKNYNAVIAGASRVGDRNVTRVDLQPKDQHRYPFVFFVDNETGLMMKMVVSNLQGQPLERFHFVVVDYDTVTEKDLMPQIKDFKRVNHSMASGVTDQESKKSWSLAWVPAGFEEEKTKMNNWSGEENDRQVFMFSDGLSAFSVFVEPFGDVVKGDTSTQMGSTSAVSHYAQFAGQMFLVTVVGEIPIMTAKQIALSVRPSS